MSAPVIAFLSDYGLSDEYVGVCHGVIAERCPQARVIDVTHLIPRQDVRAGALALAAALPFLPAGVALAVVDPGVGGPRRAIALRAGEREQLLVGPDNGLLMAAAERFGGVAEAFDIGASSARLKPVSRTFHGRDIFAPVAAALAAGERLAQLGEPVSQQELVRLDLQQAEVRDGVLVAHVLRIDVFGNLSLDADAQQLAATGVRDGDEVSVRAGTNTLTARRADSYGDVPAGSLVLYEDSQRSLALAVNRGSAAAMLGVDSDDELQLAPV